MHINRYLLDPEVFDAYEAFIDVLFELYTGAGKDAKLKSLIVSPNGDRRRSLAFVWEDSFDQHFSDHEAASGTVVFELYDAVMRAQRSGIKA
ncbi:hypothetical protein HFO28_20230 [Rhizobium leguminosarum]|uniref:hypothetical protein n=1 Tax=Rhizobium leguminosarum TaxID=384 RepID=UPI001C937FEE|nr:hypothetical protein [Rhizobium leguminosarum]MBY5745899.1 hypothetical protein [Rhizobium leguminosarum]